MLFLPIILVSIFSLFFACFLIKKVKKFSSGEGKQIEMAQAIREGAVAFLKRQYSIIAILAIFLFFLIYLVFDLKTAFGFLIGVMTSGISGLIGMFVSTQANLKVTEAARTGLKPAFDLSFSGGQVSGFLVVGLGLLVISGLYLLTNDFRTLIALGFGGSLISIFARLGGGIYIKAADVGAELVGKIEEEIPKDSPRNPAVIAARVGKNIGGCVSMAADIFETYVITMVAVMILGDLNFPGQMIAIALPLYLASIAILASIISTYFVGLQKTESHGGKQVSRGAILTLILFRGLIIAGILSAVGFWPIISQAAPSLGLSSINLYLPALAGFLIAAGIFLIIDFFSSKKYRPIQSIVRASQSGHGTNIIAGLVVGMKSTAWTVILISIGVLISFNLAGMYGLAVAAATMLSLAGLIIALDSYGSIADNASEIVEMSGLPEEVRKNTDALNTAGNTVKTITKGYAIVGAGLAALVLFSVYTQELLVFGGKAQFLLNDPEVLVGLFFGGIITYYFSVMVLAAVGKTAGKVVEETRRQFREIPGLMDGHTRPEYSKCVDIVIKAALKEMVLPALLPLIFPVLIYFILGPVALAGLLIGSIIVGIFLAVKMTIAGVAWNSAKKYIEEENLGGKGSSVHQAAVTGDTVGELCKDAASPAISSMIKVLNIVALLIVYFLVH